MLMYLRAFKNFNLGLHMGLVDREEMGKQKGMLGGTVWEVTKVNIHHMDKMSAVEIHIPGLVLVLMIFIKYL